MCPVDQTKSTHVVYLFKYMRKQCCVTFLVTTVKRCNTTTYYPFPPLALLNGLIEVWGGLNYEGAMRVHGAPVRSWQTTDRTTLNTGRDFINKKYYIVTININLSCLFTQLSEAKDDSCSIKNIKTARGSIKHKQVLS